MLTHLESTSESEQQQIQSLYAWLSLQRDILHSHFLFMRKLYAVLIGNHCKKVNVEDARNIWMEHI